MLMSIIVPIYNVEKYIERCLNSMINQTYKNIEIICINDGSTDNSLAILEKYQTKDSRIKIINQNNSGVSIARNKGLEHANGEYVLFVDPDDWIELDSCKILNGFLEEYDYPDLIQFQFTRKVNNKTLNCSENPFKQNKKVNVTDNLEKILGECTMVPCWNKLYKLSFIKKQKVQFPAKIKTFEDFIFAIDLYMYNPTMLVINDILYNYNKDNINSVTKQSSYKRFKMHQEAWKILLKKLSTIKNEKLKLYSYEHYIINLNLFWNDLVFSKNKKEYLNELKSVRKLINNNYTSQNIKLCDNRLKEAYWLQFWLYRIIIRPIGKYCIVLPYRKIIAVARGN